MELRRHPILETLNVEAVPTRPIRLPAYLTWQMAVCVGVLVLVTSAAALGRLVTMPNSFAGYSDLFSDDPEQAAIEQGLACRPIGRGPSATATVTAQRCAGNLAAGPFARITMTVAVHGADQRTMRAALTVRENALTLGDLVLLWDDPTIEFTGELATVSWPAQRIAATTRRTVEEQDQGINYRMPITLITFRAIEL